MPIGGPLRQWFFAPAAVGDVGSPPQIPQAQLSLVPNLQLPKAPLSRCLSSLVSSTTMWNDEDNNPYGAFDHHESRLSDSLHSAALQSPRKLSPLPGRNALQCC